MILLLNGAFGIGKTTVARALLARMPNSVLFDPEPIGIALQRTLRLAGQTADDFQDFSTWRRLTVAGARIARWRFEHVIVPMAFSNPRYLDEVRTAIRRFEPRVFHYCLIAPTEVVHDRLRRRGADPAQHAWQYRRASECCETHTDKAFARQVDTVDRSPEEIASQLFRWTA